MPSDAFEYLYLDVSIASKLRLPTRVQSAFAKLFINVYNQQANKMPTPSQTGRTILIRQYSFHHSRARYLLAGLILGRPIDSRELSR